MRWLTKPAPKRERPADTDKIRLRLRFTLFPKALNDGFTVIGFYWVWQVHRHEMVWPTFGDMHTAWVWVDLWTTSTPTSSWVSVSESGTYQMNSHDVYHYRAIGR